MQRHRCPYCHVEFQTSEYSDDVEMSPDCGHQFTLGESRRGRPDPANQTEVEALQARVTVLEQQVAAMQVKLDAAVSTLNSVARLTLPIG